MIHGIGLGGGALLALAAALFALYVLRAREGPDLGVEDASRPVVALLAVAAVTLWITVIVGTYVIFPPYRAAAPEGATILAQYPRSMLLADPETAWLHSFAMETKEHLPFIAAILATAVAAIAGMYRASLFRDRLLRRTAAFLLVVCFMAVAYVSLLGVFVNKVAPLE